MATKEENWTRRREDINKLKNATDISNKSLTSYTKALGDSIKLAGQLKDVERKLNKLRKDRAVLEKQGLKHGDAKLDQLEDEIEFQEEEIKRYGKAIKMQKESLKLHKAIGHSIAKTGKALLSKGWQMLKEMPKYYTEQDKAVRETALSMGTMNKESSVMFNTMSKTSIMTSQIGVNTKALAKLQGDYSTKLGKSVRLGELGFKAMAEMQQAAFGDSSLTADYASNMENFGSSVVDANKSLEDGMNLAQKMGVNVGKFAQDFAKNVELAHGYNFKGGLDDLKKMTAESIKFRISLESISGVADQLITPEGAVEMSAKLQVLGGAWAKMADPFSLMFKARHDMKGLEDDLIQATKGAAQFNKESGLFEISGMEMHRLREVAKATGQDYKEISKTAKALSRDMVIKGELDPGLSDDAKDFIGSTAQWDKKSQEWQVEIVDKDGKQRKTEINQIHKGMMDTTIGQAKSLEDRAKAAMTFSDKIDALIESVKSTLLPFFKGFEEVIKPIFDSWTGALTGKDGALMTLGDKMQSWGKATAEWLIDWKAHWEYLKDNWGEWLVTGLVVLGLFKLPQWIANGRALAMGFLSGTRGFGGGGGGGGGGMYPMSSNPNYNPNQGGPKFNAQKMDMSKYNQAPKNGFSMKGNKWGGGGMRGVGVGMGLGALGMGADMWRGSMEDPNSEGGQALGVLGSAAKYGAMGAMLGPWGALAGGVVGAGMGMWENHQENKRIAAAKEAARSGGVNPAMIDVADAKVNPSGLAITTPAGKIFQGSANDSAYLVDETKSGKNKGGETHITFGPLKITGKIILENSNGQLIDGNLFKDNPKAQAELAEIITNRVVKMSCSKSIS